MAEGASAGGLAGLVVSGASVVLAGVADLVGRVAVLEASVAGRAGADRVAGDREAPVRGAARFPS